MFNLTFLILCPLVMALVIALIPRNYQFLIRLLSLAAAFLSMCTAVGLFVAFRPGLEGLQFEQIKPWVDAVGISYHVGADGINIGILLMGAVVGFAATCVSYEIRERQKEYYVLLLLMISGILGAFASYDLFFFYFFHELALVPTFIMIGVWGRGVDRDYAAFKMTIYLSVGALLVLIGLIGIYLAVGIGSFDLLAISKHVASNPIASNVQELLFPVLLFGFGILVSLWPFHTWAPLGYGAAPTATAMLHAGVLKKFGLYGLLRVAIPLMPEAAKSWMHILAVLCLGNILYCGLVAMRQKNLNLLIGNSSVAHMGFVFLGIATFSLVGVTGAVVVMIAHGLLAALTFGLSGYLYHQVGSLEMERMGGLLRKMPFFGTVLVMAMLAGCGLPGFANFVGESLVLFGSWTEFRIVTVLATWGALIIGGVYMLRAIRQILHGPLPERWKDLQDPAGMWRKLPFVILTAALLFFGCYPTALTEKINPVATQIVSGWKVDGSAKTVDLATAQADTLNPTR